MLSIGAGSAIRSLLLGIGGISGLMFMLGDRLVGEGTGTLRAQKGRAWEVRGWS